MTAVPPAQRTAGPGELPAGLRRSVLAASLERRPAGRPTPAAPPLTPLAAFIRASGSLAAVLESLVGDEWRVPVLRGLDVQGLVGHLIGVEADVQLALQGDPRVGDADHVESTQAAAEEQSAEPPTRTLGAWRAAVTRSTAAFAAADPEQPVALHTMRVTVDSLLVVRTFELWAHEGDVRRATGRPPRAPDDSTLTLMTDLAARSLPVGADRIGLRDPIDLRLVLTGPAGGTWQLRLGPPAGRAARVRVVTEAIGFCGLAANRLDPADLSLDPRGDPARVGDVLSAAAALALD